MARQTRKKAKPKMPPKEECRCVAFCIEDCERTGRVCKLKLPYKVKSWP